MHGILILILFKACHTFSIGKAMMPPTAGSTAVCHLVAMQVQPVLGRADLADRQRRLGVAGALHGAAGLTRSVRTLPAAGAVSMNFAHFCINSRRFSNRSPRR
jgi:hypothetical protein